MRDDGDPLCIDLSAWVAKAKANPVTYRARQVTEILLTAIGLTPGLRNALHLKGGILMAVAYDSPRTTTDIDFTAEGDTDGIIEPLHKALDQGLSRAAAQLGYVDLVCRVQNVAPRPRRETFDTAQNPALQLTIGSALRRTHEESRLARGEAPNVLRLDITFKEPIDAVQLIRLTGSDSTIKAYALTDLIAEKLRALLQQAVRNRARRQDVYDIALLIDRFTIDNTERVAILHALQTKARARSLVIDRDSMRDPVVADRARRDWPTLAAELEGDLPDFDTSFTKVCAFYESLPWQ